jgi:hypothetical protein
MRKRLLFFHAEKRDFIRENAAFSDSRWGSVKPFVCRRKMSAKGVKTPAISDKLTPA